MLPRDPLLLLSVVNTELRDRYDSLCALCGDFDEDADALCSRLLALGYCYDEGLNRFICKEAI